MRPTGLLQGAGVVFLLGFGVHVADHARRGIDASPPAVTLIGALQGVLVVFAVWMAWTGRRGAPLAAIAVGLLSVALVTFGHLLPSHSPFSDSFVSPPATNVNAFSWASAVGEVATGLAFAIAGVKERLQARDDSFSSALSQP